MAEYVGAIDQGTTSTRFIVFDRDAQIVAMAQREHAQITPRPGWVEHDPDEIWARTEEVIAAALAQAGAHARELRAVGITNQRESTLLWDRVSGEPLHNVLVWQDTRTEQLVRALAREAGVDCLRERVGLPLASYFSGPKLAWLLEHVPGARARAHAGELAFGTIDSWLLWKLTGGGEGALHATDVTNASRTMLMDLETLAWHEQSLELMGIPPSLLPRICASSGIFGEARAGALAGVTLAGVLGDQQAALFGQTCFRRGEAKNTYGTGSFLLLNTGERPVRSQRLLSTVAYQREGAAAHFALEGSIAVTGALVQWLRDQLGLIETAAQVEELARSVPDNGGVYFVPAFSGLFAPHWREDARGVIVGLTAYANRGHIARAALEATAWQTREVLDECAAVAPAPFTELRVDGGMTANALLMQFQADVLGMDVVRPAVRETTALGAAFAAGLAVGFWADESELRERWREERRWKSQMEPELREREYTRWRRAVTRSFDWVEPEAAS
jgi:glycerol kinase